jgi:hypothetical protein
MVTKTEEKLFKEIQEIKKETKILKDLIFLLLKDPEGEYRKTFINHIQKKPKQNLSMFLPIRKTF